MNTVDTALREKLEHIWNKNSRRGSINQRMISDIESLIRSLTNEAELRGRQDERTQVALDNYWGKTFSDSTNYSLKFDKFIKNNEKRRAALLARKEMK